MKKIREKISIKGVIIGSVADILGSNLWGLVLIVYLIFRYNLLTIPPNQLESEISSIIRHEPLIFAANLLVGSFFSILGGYIAAHIAKRNELLNGALASFLCVSLGIYSMTRGASSDLFLLQLFSLILSPALALFGGFLKKKQRSKSSSGGLLQPNTVEVAE